MFIVFGQAPLPVEPTEGAFDNPSFRQDLEGMQLGTFDDLDEITEHGLSPVDKALFVAAGGRDFKQLGQHAKQAEQDQMCATAIRDTCRVHHHSQGPAHGIYRDVAFAAFEFLAAVIAPLPPFCTVLTDWLSMMARVGSGWRPACTRTRRRSWCMTWSHKPRLRQRHIVMYTTSHGGKSLGNSRHWQPVRCTYRIALQIARRECLRGRPFCWGSINGAKIAHSSSRKSLAYPLPFRFIHQQWTP